MTRALVTGGAGFIGHHLCAALLERGAEVTVVDDLSTGRRELLEELGGRVELVELDVRRQRELAELFRELRPELVFHLAGLHFIPACNADPVATLAINTLGTESVLAAIKAAGGARRLVFSSTAAVYRPDSALCRESDPPGPDDIYGQSKLFAEELIRRASRETGLSAVSARLFNVYGPGETNPHVIPEILEQARAGDDIRLGNLVPRRDYVYVDDVVSALVRLAEIDVEPPATVNVGTGCDHSVAELVAALGSVVGRPLRAVVDPARVRKTDRPILRGDVAVARRALGWEPRFDLDRGLRATWTSLS